MADKVKAFSDKNFEELNKKIDTLQNKIDANHNTLQVALDRKNQKA